MTGNVRCFNDSNGDGDCHLCARRGGCHNFGIFSAEDALGLRPIPDPAFEPWTNNISSDWAQPGTHSFSVLSRFDVPITDPRRHIVLREKMSHD